MSTFKKISCIVFTSLAILCLILRFPFEVFIHEAGHSIASILNGAGVKGIELHENSTSYAHLTGGGLDDNAHLAGAYSIFFVLAIMLFRFGKVGIVGGTVFLIVGIRNIVSNYTWDGSDFTMITSWARFIFWFLFHIALFHIWPLIRYIKAHSASRPTPSSSRPVAKVAPAQTRSQTKLQVKSPSPSHRVPARSLPRSSRGPIV